MTSVALSSQKVLETADAQTAYWTAGHGRKVVVIHGGPGLSHTYLRDALIPLANDATLVFFDQPGCGVSKTKGVPVTATLTFRNAGEVVDKLTQGEEYIIVAHSWGTIVAIRAICEKLQLSKPKSLVLLNPVPLQRSDYDDAGRRLFDRVPENLRAKIGELAAEGTPAAGRELMRLALAAYSGRASDLPSVDLDYNIGTYNSVASSLDNFDFRSCELSIPTTLIFGSTDYITPDSARNVPAFKRANQVVLPGGHFIASDAQLDVLTLVRAALKSS